MPTHTNSNSTSSGYQQNKAKANCAGPPPRSYLLQPSLNIENLPERFRGAKVLPPQYIPPIPMCTQSCCPPGFTQSPCMPQCPQISCFQPQCGPNFCPPPCPTQPPPCYPSSCPMPPPYCPPPCPPYPYYPYCPPPPCCIPYPPCPPCPQPCPPPEPPCAPCHNPCQVNPMPKGKCGGQGKIICIPKGQRPPQFGSSFQPQGHQSPIPGFGAGGKEQPASFNNCNFYVSELPKGFQNKGMNGNNFGNNSMASFDPDCMPEGMDPCDTKNYAAGDDKPMPPPVGYPGTTRKLWGTIDDEGVHVNKTDNVIPQPKMPPRAKPHPLPVPSHRDHFIDNRESNRHQDYEDDDNRFEPLPPPSNHRLQPSAAPSNRIPSTFPSNRTQAPSSNRYPTRPPSRIQPMPSYHEPPKKMVNPSYSNQSRLPPPRQSTRNFPHREPSSRMPSQKPSYRQEHDNDRNRYRRNEEDEGQADYCIPQDYDKPPKVCKPVVWRRRHPCCMPAKADRLKTLCQRCHNRFAQNMKNCGLPMPPPPEKRNQKKPVETKREPQSVYNTRTEPKKVPSQSSATFSSPSLSTVKIPSESGKTTYASGKTTAANTFVPSTARSPPPPDSLQNLYTGNLNYTSSFTVAVPQHYQPPPHNIKRSKSAPHMCVDAHGQIRHANGVKSEAAAYPNHNDQHGERTMLEVGVAAVRQPNQEHARTMHQNAQPYHPVPNSGPHHQKSKIKRIIIEKNPFDKTQHITVIKDREDQGAQEQHQQRRQANRTIQNPNFYGVDPAANCNYDVYNVHTTNNLQNAMKEIPGPSHPQPNPYPLQNQRVIANCDPEEMSELDEILKLIQAADRNPRDECNPRQNQLANEFHKPPKHIQVVVPDNDDYLEDAYQNTRYVQQGYPMQSYVPQQQYPLEPCIPQQQYPTSYNNTKVEPIQFPHHPKMHPPENRNFQQIPQIPPHPPHKQFSPPESESEHDLSMKVVPQQEYMVYDNPIHFNNRKIQITNLMHTSNHENNVKITHHDVSGNKSTAFNVKPHESYTVTTTDQEPTFSVSSSHLPLDHKPFDDTNGINIDSHFNAEVNQANHANQPIPAQKTPTQTRIQVTDKGSKGKEIKIFQSTSVTFGQQDGNTGHSNRTKEYGEDAGNSNRHRGHDENSGNINRNKGYDEGAGNSNRNFGNEGNFGNRDSHTGKDTKNRRPNENSFKPTPPPPANNTYRPKTDNRYNDGESSRATEDKGRKGYCAPKYRCVPLKNCKSPRMITCQGQKPIFSLFPPACPIRETNASILRKKPPAHCSKHNQDATPFPDYCLIRLPHHDETFKHKLQFVDYCADGNDGTRVDNEIPVQYRNQAQVVKKGVKRRLHA